MKSIFTATVTVGLGMALATAQAEGLAKEKFVKATVTVSAEKITAGTPFDVTVIAEIKSGYHIQAHQPTEADSIPTTLTFEKVEGLIFGEVKYPEPSPVKVSFLDKPLLSYEGKLELKLTVQIAPNAAIGKREFHGVLKYQACNEKMCFAPQKVEVVIPLEIMAGK